MDPTFITALTLGLLGSTHCIGMCGGIVGTISSGGASRDGGRPRSGIGYHLTYNAGRIASYSFAGALAGVIGAQSTRFSPELALPLGEMVAGLFMIAAGAYLFGWTRSVSWIEKIGNGVWRHIRPIGARFLPVKSPMHAFGLGLVWGWLPCGLVYSALVLAALSGSPQRGALMMLGFGLGTLPSLLVVGGAYDFLKATLRRPVVRQIAGGFVMVLGVYTSASALTGDGHHHHNGADAALEPIPHLHLQQPLPDLGNFRDRHGPRRIPDDEQAAR
mgnify:CR=1 FL=1